jgi:hypothetical protein
VLLQHLLKWDHQPKLRSRSWAGTIREQRVQVELTLTDNPGLTYKLPDVIRDAYRIGRTRAIAETDVPEDVFPSACQYAFDQVMTREIVYETPPKRHRRRRESKP